MSHHPPPPPLSSPTAGTLPRLLKCFTNCQLCISGELIPQDLYFSPDTGLITPNYYYRVDGVERIDLRGGIVAPGFLDLQTNGMGGVHFTQLGKEGGPGKGRGGDEMELGTIARKEVEGGVTGWWATVPTVEGGRWREILPLLHPRPFPHSASLLGAHAEGPYLHPLKKGAHNSSYFHHPSTTPPESLYDLPTTSASLKLLTLAPELPGALALITHLREHLPSLVISLGHSTSSFSTGLAALGCGARALTHVFNAMAPLHHREPGLPGLMGCDLRPYYSVIADGIHLHASVLRMALRADPGRCILITDSIELAGLEDGIYPGNGQIAHRQRKVGNRVTLVSEEEEEQERGPDTTTAAGDNKNVGEKEEVLIGSCCTILTCVNNMVSMTGCSLAEAVRCVTENVAGLMDERGRGVLEMGRRADFVVLDREGDGLGFEVRETWVEGLRVYSKEERKE